VAHWRNALISVCVCCLTSNSDGDPVVEALGTDERNVVCRVDV